MADLGEMKVKVSADITDLQRKMHEAGGVTTEFAKKAQVSVQGLGDTVTKSASSFNVLKSGAGEAAGSMLGLGASLPTGGFLLLGFALVEGVKKLYEWITAETQAEKIQNALNQAINNSISSTAAEVTKLEALVNVARDAANSTQIRQQAINDLNKLYPQYLGNLSLENINTSNVTIAVLAQIAALQRLARAKANNTLLDKATEKQQDLKQQIKDFKPGLFKGGDDLSDLISDYNKATQSVDAFTKAVINDSKEQVLAETFLKKLHPTGRLKQIDEEIKQLKDQKELHASTLAETKDFNAKIKKLEDERNLIDPKEVKIKKPKATKEVETITDSLAKLDRQIGVLSQEEIIFNTDKAKEKISDIESTIKHLVDKFKLTANSSFILNLEARIQGIKLDEFAKDVFKGKKITPVQLPFEIAFDNSSTNEAKIAAAKKSLEDQFKPDTFKGQNEAVQKGLNPNKNASDAEDELKDLDTFEKTFDQKIKDLRKHLHDAKLSLKVDVFAGLGEAIGQAIAGGKDPFKGIFNSLISSLGQELELLGKSLIEAAVTVKVAKEAFKKLLANPVAAIAVGIGLVALGALLKASVSKKVPGFAGGVQNFTGGVALVGERGPELVNLPRGTDVIPNNRLRESFGGGVREVPYIASTEISGPNIRIVLNRSDARDRRNT